MTVYWRKRGDVAGAWQIYLRGLDEQQARKIVGELRGLGHEARIDDSKQAGKGE